MPCSPTCANWLLHGVRPDGVKAGLTPGRCTAIEPVCPDCHAVRTQALKELRAPRRERFIQPIGYRVQVVTRPACTFRVTDAEACPSIRCAALTLAPAATAKLAVPQTARRGRPLRTRGAQR
ncbi:hypothetical protein MCAG_03247 [Micromonospora sp. ATCC 39149]|nr:hypothetical protein MCAG_03247 [Micromonospora sp. ATCC 39149]